MDDQDEFANGSSSSCCASQVSEEVYDGVVTKGLPRGGYGSSFNDSRREEGHGLIEVSRPSDATDAEPEAPADTEDKEATEAADTPAPEAPIARKEFVRFNSESVAGVAEAKEDKNQEGDVRKKGGRNHAKVPHFGDEVRFRIATHRKTGVKRAVELTVTLSAREKMDKEIEQKLETMVREFGMVDRIKAGGGFIKCCDRQEDIYFPFHEVREAAPDAQPASGDSENAPADSEAKQQRSSGQRPSKSALREGDEVSFYVYEEQDDESGRSRPRMTALRVQKLPPGTVSFEEFIRSDVEGKVTKVPKEPRNGPEILGIITLPEAAPAEAAALPAEESAEAVAAEEGSKEPKKKKGTLKRKKKVTLPFRLSDTEDMSYLPASGDRVVFDEVLDKRSGKHKAIHIRVLELNPKHRETGVIATMKDDFGFIKCAERASDAYFRFTDVMSVRNDFRVGTEVSFDVSVDSSKPDSARATRIVILPHGSVQWETVVAEEVPGEVIVAPSKRSNNNSRGGHAKLLQKGHHGRIRFTLPDGKMVIDLLPELKQQVDAAFIANDPSDVKEDEEVRFEFPTSLSKFERAMIHEYCEWLGITHESAGEKQNRRLAVVAKSKLLAADIAAKQASIPESEVEFKMEDVSDVRYDPRVGDQIKFQLALSKRTKQLICKSVTCVKAAASSQKKASEAKDSGKAEATKGEGFITAVKSEGFGFIRPANKGQGVEENIFFHVNAIVSGQRVDELKEGMEVQYTVSYDDKKKKSRALGITVVPAGTIKEVEVQRVRGVVTRASILNRVKGGVRFSKSSNNKPASTVGKIHIASSEGTNEEDKDDADVDDDEQEGEEEAEAEAEATEDADAQGEEETKAEPETSEATEGKQGKKGERKADSKKKAEKSVYFYHIQDITDQTVVLREGDEVEFLPLATAKGMRATKIQVVASHALQGVVVKVSEDLSGIIRADGDDALDARFNARNVLRGDILKEGDRVEFAYKPAVPLSKKKKAAASEEASEETTDASESAPTLGQATSVLRIGSSSSEDQQASRREARSVNSTLLQAMRQVGVNAMVASRMAKGPDGTRGFKESWRRDLANATTKASDVAAKVADEADKVPDEADKAAEVDTAGATEQSGAEASA